jgi:hypothetical protein
MSAVGCQLGALGDIDASPSPVWPMNKPRSGQFSGVIQTVVDDEHSLRTCGGRSVHLHCKTRVRITLESGHVRCKQECLLRANSGHCLHKQKNRLAAVNLKLNFVYSRGERCCFLLPAPNCQTQCAETAGEERKRRGEWCCRHFA